MSKQCFCGCGREVPFGRKRVANALGNRLRDDIEMFQGALERTPDPEHDGDLRRLVAKGAPLRDKLREVIHGTIDRKDYPRDDGQRWLEEAGEHRKRLAMQALDGDYVGMSGYKQAQLLHAGVEAPAVITDVVDTGMTLNDQPRVELTVRVEPPGAEPLELKHRVFVSRVKIPRIGERMTVYIDADDPSKFTFRNDDVADDATLAAAAGPPAPDPVEQIAKLAELRASGALSEDEFAQAKQRLLAEL
jgi:putative oligomerization/nucleic acid binding protein